MTLLSTSTRTGKSVRMDGGEKALQPSHFVVVVMLGSVLRLGIKEVPIQRYSAMHTFW